MACAAHARQTSGRAQLPPIAPATGTLRFHEHDWLLERAAVRECDGGEPRRQTGDHAWLELLDRIHNRIASRIAEQRGRPRPADAHGAPISREDCAWAVLIRT
jgi:hypothetical protein